jgi:hypothetical protein
LTALITVDPNAFGKLKGSHFGSISDSQLISFLAGNGRTADLTSLALVRADLILAENLKKMSLRSLECPIFVLETEPGIDGQEWPADLNIKGLDTTGMEFSRYSLLENSSAMVTILRKATTEKSDLARAA